MYSASCLAGWTFFTNHGHVLLTIAQDPGARIRDLAEQVGITERATQRIVADLVEEGYVTRKKVGRRNFYEVRTDLPIRHPVWRDRQIGEILGLLARS